MDKDIEGVNQFIPSPDEKMAITEGVAETVEKLPEQKLEESKRKMDEAGNAVVYAGQMGMGKIDHMVGGMFH